MKRMLLSAVLALSCSLFSVQASAGASDAIAYLSSGPTSAKMATRDVFTGGSFRMYVPQTQTQFVSITPPSFSAGCNGIDAAFGGFSFINGEKLKQMVKAIMSAAPGYALDLAIRTLCPMCADIMQKIRELSNWANSLSLDSCGAAMSLVNTAAEGIVSATTGTDDPAAWLRQRQNRSGEYYKNACKSANQGQAEWYDTAMCETGDFLDTTGKSIKKFMNGVNSGKSWSQLTSNDKTELDTALGGTNKTFIGALGLGIEDADAINLLMSVLGTSFQNPNTGGEVPLPGWGFVLDVKLSDEAKGDKTETELALDALIYVLMVGIDGKIDESIYNSSEKELLSDLKEQFNQEEFSIPRLPYYECVDATGTVTNDKPSDFFRCASGKVKETNLMDAAANNNIYLSNKGYVTEVAEILIKASQNIANGTGLTDEQMALINLSPLPVYRMLKVSAIYPEAGKDLVATYSKLIALMLMRSHFVDQIQPDSVQEVEWDKVAPYRSIVNSAISKLAMQIETKKEDILGAEMAHIQNLNGILGMVDRVIAEKAVTSGAAGSMLFSRTHAPSGVTGAQ